MEADGHDFSSEHRHKLNSLHLANIIPAIRDKSGNLRLKKNMFAVVYSLNDMNEASETIMRDSLGI